LQDLIEKSSSHKKVVRERGYWQQAVFSFPPDWIVCSVIGCAALCFNLYRLSMPSIWFDEALSIERARQPLGVLWKIIFTTQPNMAFYYLVLHFWLQGTQLLGLLPDEVVVRLPSTIFAVLSAIVLYLTGRRFLGRMAGVVSTGLYIINALQLTYAQETRSYSLQLLLTCLTWYALFAALSAHKRRWGWWICYCLATALAVYTHIFSILILSAHVITYGCLLILPNYWYKQTRRECIIFIASLTCIVILLIPLIIVSRQGAKTGWLPVPRLKDIESLFIALAGNNRAFLLFLALVYACGIFVVVRACKRWVVKQGKDQSPAQTLLVPQNKSQEETLLPQIMPALIGLLCWWLVPLVASYIISQGATRLFSTRYLVAIVPPLLLFAGGCVEVVPWRRIRFVLAAALLVAACFSVPYYYRSAQVENWKEVTFWLQHHARGDDGMVCYDNAQGCQLCIEYYLRAYPDGISFPADAPGAFPWVNYDLTNQTGDTEAAVDPAALARYGAHHTHLFFIVGRLSGNDHVARARSAQSWLDSHYAFEDQIVTRTVTIRLYSTNHKPPQQ